MKITVFTGESQVRANLYTEQGFSSEILIETLTTIASISPRQKLFILMQYGCHHKIIQ